MSDRSDRDIFDSLAGDALSLFKTTIVLSGLYLTAFGLVFRGTGMDLIIDILNAGYTQMSIQALIAAMIGSILSYRQARRLSVSNEPPNDGILPDRKLSMNYVSAAGIALVLSILLMILGILEGIAGEAPDMAFPVIASIILFAIWISVPFSILSVIDWLSDRSSVLRQYLYAFL